METEIFVIEEKEPSQWRTALVYGSITGLGLIILSLLYYIFDSDYEHSDSQKYIGWAILILGIVLGIKNQKDERGGYITYGKAFGTGFFVSLIASLIIGIYSYIFIKWVDPGMLVTLKELSEERMREQGNYTEEQIEMGMSYVDKMMKPYIIALTGSFSYLFMGVIFSLIISIFMKRERNTITV